MKFSRPEWVAFLFSRGSSQPRNQTKVSYIAGGFFANWAIREVLYQLEYNAYLYTVPFTFGLKTLLISIDT